VSRCVTFVKFHKTFFAFLTFRFSLSQKPTDGRFSKWSVLDFAWSPNSSAGVKVASAGVIIIYALPVKKGFTARN
jgi:hypothetical protein